MNKAIKYTKLEAYLLSCINSEDVVLTTDTEKINYLFECFKSEGVNNRSGVFAMTEWLMGLPSCINMHYTYYDIAQFWGCSEHGTKVQNWWKVCARALFSIKEKNEKKQITSLSVIAKEWFDQKNGNSYFSAQIRVNDELIYLPFQYGYGCVYIQSTHEALVKHGFKCGENWNVEKWANQMGIKYNFQIIENCKNRDVKAWGKA